MTKTGDFSDQQLLCISSDPQEELSSALAKRKINLFQRVLDENNANPELVDEKLQISIFEKCCQTPGCAEFIRACVSWGCNVNKVLIVTFTFFKLLIFLFFRLTKHTTRLPLTLW